MFGHDAPVEFLFFKGFGQPLHSYAHKFVRLEEKVRLQRPAVTAVFRLGTKRVDQRGAGALRRIRKAREEKKAYLATISGVALGSDAFFPFGDNIERAAKSGVTYIAEPGGSIRDDNVIETCNEYGMVMAFTKMRLFHH